MARAVPSLPNTQIEQIAGLYLNNLRMTGLPPKNKFFSLTYPHAFANSPQHPTPDIKNI
jgi:hypothetical protein